VNVSFTLKRDGLADYLQNVARSLDTRGRRSVLEQMGAELLEITVENFGPEENPGRPTNWPPYSPNYKAKYGQPPDLILGRRLINNFRFDRGTDFISLVNDTPYATIQQHGGKGGSGTVPPRPYLPIQGDGESATLTPYAERRVVARAEMALIRFIKSV